MASLVPLWLKFNKPFFIRKIDMALETERKYLDVDFDSVRIKLKELGAIYEGIRFETNILYGNTDPSCKREIRVVRLRLIEEATRKYNIFTVKGPAEAEENDNALCKIREELETEVGDAEIFNKILEQMGYKESLVYEKLRESWKYSFDIESGRQIVQVDMDKLTFCNCLEIEGSCDAINHMAKLLNLDNSKISTTSYTRLYEKWISGKEEDNLPSLVFKTSEKNEIRKSLGLK